MIEVCEYISLPGADINEDFFACDGRCAILLDGATGLLPSGIEVRRYVRDFAELFLKQAAKSIEIYDAVNAACDELRERYSAFDIDGEGDILPSAAMIAIAERDGIAEIVMLGDCTAVISKNDGKQVLHLTELDRLDDKAKAEGVKISREQGITVREAMQAPAVRDMLVRHRRLMNKDGGYETLAFNMRPITEAEVIKIPTAEILEITLFSDGFDALSECFLADEREPLSSLYRRLREEENADADFEKNPRFKAGDDATAVVLKFI